MSKEYRARHSFGELFHIALRLSFELCDSATLQDVNQTLEYWEKDDV